MTTAAPGRGLGSDPPDAVLIRRISDGDDTALGVLYDRYGGPAFALALQITGDPACAQDVVYEVFLALWRDPATYDPSGGNCPDWVLAATQRRAAQAVRRGEAVRGRNEIPAEPAAVHSGTVPVRPPPVQSAVRPGPHGERARHALHVLPAAEREVLLLACYAGRSQREIAEQTGTPLATVQARMFAGLRRLRDQIDLVSDVESDPR
jgi:RNA polymerase sigma factor (sigma-70 family)